MDHVTKFVEIFAFLMMIILRSCPPALILREYEDETMWCGTVVVYSNDVVKKYMLNIVYCIIACPSNCLSCEWSDTISATVCNFGKCALRTFQDTSQSNRACLSMIPLCLSFYFLLYSFALVDSQLVHTLVLYFRICMCLQEFFHFLNTAKYRALSVSVHANSHV